MKKFHFKLETVLKLKEKALNDKMLEFAQISKTLIEQENKLNDIFGQKDNINSYLVNTCKQEGLLNIQEIMTNQNYMRQIDTNIRNQQQLIKQIQLVMKKKQVEVQEALKDRDILEKLKEKQKEAHFKEILQKEAIELDDLAISRYKAG